MFKWQAGCTTGDWRERWENSQQVFDVFSILRVRKNNVGSVTYRLKQHINKELIELPRTRKNTEVPGMNRCWMQSPTLITFNNKSRQLRNRGGGDPGFKVGRVSSGQDWGSKGILGARRGSTETQCTSFVFVSTLILQWFPPYNVETETQRS